MGFDPKQDALQKEETNRRILDAGFCIFSEKSIDKVSMANVANKAGIGIATLYRYYRTKPELVVAVGTHVWRNFIRDYTPIRNEAVPKKALNSYNEMVDKLAIRFRRIYVKGENDKTLCTEMSEKAMFLSIVHLMLAAVTRYAIGLVYEKDSESYKELILLKNMIMREFSQKNK